jgi:hypothetical protein
VRGAGLQADATAVKIAAMLGAAKAMRVALFRWFSLQSYKGGVGRKQEYTISRSGRIGRNGDGKNCLFLIARNRLVARKCVSRGQARRQ